MSEAANATSRDNNGDSGLNGKLNVTKLLNWNSVSVCEVDGVSSRMFTISSLGFLTIKCCPLWPFIFFFRRKAKLKGGENVMHSCVYWQWSHQWRFDQLDWQGSSPNSYSVWGVQVGLRFVNKPRWKKWHKWAQGNVDTSHVIWCTVLWIFPKYTTQPLYLTQCSILINLHIKF